MNRDNSDMTEKNAASEKHLSIPMNLTQTGD